MIESWVWLAIAGGLGLLAVGGDLVVRGSVGVARNLNMSAVVIGIVLMGFGTSAPELVTSLNSALQGAPAIAVGNVVGSNIANVLLIAGLAAAATGCATSRALVMRDGVVMAGLSVALAALIYFDALSWPAGAAFLAVLVVYLWAATTGRTAGASASAAPPSGDRPPPALPIAVALFGAGLAATLFGADLLVDGSVALAEALGAPQALIGLTIVAVGTSLPELAATVAAAARGKSELAIGNVIGSNIFNIGAIMGVTALVAPLPAPETVARFDIWAMLAATFAVLAFAWSGRRLTRFEGAVLLGLYALYLVLTVRVSGALG